MIRVDHAGERGADTIYNGQWDVLKDTESGDLIKVRTGGFSAVRRRADKYFLAHVGTRKNPFGNI